MRLNVFIERMGAYERVGVLEGVRGSVAFSYDEDYLHRKGAQAISPALALQAGPFDPSVTRCFFDGLVPEGSLRHDIESAKRVARGDYLALLDVVRDEPIGALLFSEAESLDGLNRSYASLEFSHIERLASLPAQTALDLTLESRISLAGAQSKVGLYHVGDAPDTGWFLPRGTAPSSHILKACGSAYRDETVCEALCMRAAAYFDLPAERCFLVPVDEGEPLLAVERYDRLLPEGEDVERVDGLVVPRRLHQMDMCQASGSVPSTLKYEPTGSNYLNLMADILHRFSADQMGDRILLGYYQLFDYAVGNCDNHLKNWSLLWSEDWSSMGLAPLYDVVCTTMYPKLVREMGVSFGGDRLIDNVDRAAVEVRLDSMGIPAFVRETIIEDAVRDVPGTLERAAEDLVAEGFPQARDVLARMMQGVRSRLARLGR